MTGTPAVVGRVSRGSDPTDRSAPTESQSADASAERDAGASGAGRIADRAGTREDGRPQPEATDAGRPRSTDRTPTDEEILAHARVHARSVADAIGVDLDALEWAVSARAKRRAGACRWSATDETATIVLSRRAYERYDRTDFEAIVRHELIHAWEYQRFGESDHGSRFRERAERFDVPIHCESFTEPRYRLRCRASACDWTLDRHRASKPVKTPSRYRCGACGGDLVVEHVESGRTWEGAAGYGGARSALGDDW